MSEFYLGNLILKDQPTALMQFPQDLLVITPGYEGGYKEIKLLEHKEILLNVNDAWYYGPHDSADSVPETELADYEKQTALLIK